MTKHTPGPWAVINTISGALSINAAPRVPIGTIGGMGWHLGEETARANARLIAAAPELLAACQALMRAEAMQTEGKRDGATMGQISLAIDAARAAITKAQGEG